MLVFLNLRRNKTIAEFSSKKIQGFVLTELLIVMGIITILFAIGTLVFGSLQKESSLDEVVSKIKTTLYKAQSQTINNIVSGVYFEQSRFVFFEGSTYVEGNPQNLVETLPGGLQLISINLPASRVTFLKINGYVSNYAPPMNLTLLEPQTGKIRLISINKLGMVEIQ